ncbi:Aspartate aminotransferase [Candidatus Ornithobacterium hominis]|uniref:Aminotransferase n=1 Tax=Candidatus Ornithobacterium hominis TaxID=2497989 RepID=A0A383TWQ8_9FLAO|nr:pyridoxal phosphate-dependent aminotransferase [Candidatus Ornithobacterium hominis]MCT7904433.1 pyridoxal phosphate-dependent aminotransferase [Candidatus Ornithobacterium hominis]SZD71331.1 Aspartate aminotransferase [Candidatus Ornithobacterium hominis]SZD72008.1 Aspartate aminotransferase [Candidatus Ornithobacterium hominis]
MEISKRLQSLKPSATIGMAAKARELRAAGKDIISLSLGEPDFETPDFIKSAAIEAIHQNYNHYSPIGGFEDLKKAISNKFRRDNGLDYSTSQIVVSTGAKQAIYNVIMALVNEGDEVILPVPYWVSYSDIVGLAGGKVVEIETGVEQDFKITPEQLEKSITEKTKVLMYSSPCNPSGSVYSAEELAALAEVLKKHPKITVVSDEIYEFITYGEKMASMAKVLGMYEQTVTINGLAKGYAMTGWRIGYIGAPEKIAKACEKLQGQVTSGTNSIAQRAAITALEADPSQLRYMVDAFERRRSLVMEMATEIPGFKLTKPQGAFYIFPDVSAYFGKELKGTKINSANDLAMFILEEAEVACVAGEAFGSPNCIRMSYASSEETLREAFARIKKALS